MSGPGKRTRWTEEEFESVFSQFPPTGKAPSPADLERLASELQRTPDAVGWVWGDGKGLLAGKTGTSSRAQREYMIARWGAPKLDDGPAPGPADVILLGCVKTKQQGRHPAAELYVSPLWKKRHRHAELSGKPWYVFSSAYGLLDRTTVVETYDQRLNDLAPAEQRERGEQVIVALEERLGDLRGKVVEVHGGSAYVNAIQAPLKARGGVLSVPLAWLKIGDQLHWYDEADGIEKPLWAPAPRRERTSHPTKLRTLSPVSDIPTRVPEHLRGIALRITTEFNEGQFDLARRGKPVQGWDGMPETIAAKRIRDAGGTDLDVRLWLTFTVALDRVRDADQLADVALKLWAAKRWAFDPREVAARPFAEIKATLMEGHVSRFHASDSWAWFRIARSLSDPALSPTVYRTVFAGQGDACELLDAVNRYGQDRRPLFPSLRGPKISRLWIRELALPGNAQITSLDALDVAVDVQVKKVTENLGMLPTQGYEVEEVRDRIQAIWREDVRENGAAGPDPLRDTPAALDPALWFFGKWGCTYCVQWHRLSPISLLCAGCSRRAE